MIKRSFLNPENILIEAGLKTGMRVVDMGAGNGFFTIPACRIVSYQGQVYAIDILEEPLSHIMSTARIEKCKNLRTLRRDLDTPASTNIKDLSCDFVIIGKILPQLTNPEYLIRETYRILKTGGIILVLEWRKEATAFGPPIESRLSKDQIEKSFSKQGFKFEKEIPTDKYHHGLVFKK